jgi:large subunit ribosomal protein L6
MVMFSFNRPTDQIRHRAMHGLIPFSDRQYGERCNRRIQKKLELMGVGFKAANQGNLLGPGIGLFTQYHFRNTKRTESRNCPGKRSEPHHHPGGNRQTTDRPGSAKIRSLRKPEPYKGKGVNYVGEVVRKKSW